MEIALWTTAREEALKNVTEESMADDDELLTQVLDANRQKYKEMVSSFVLRDGTEEEYRKAKGMRQPYRGMTRPFWQRESLLGWLKRCTPCTCRISGQRWKARNQKRFITAVGGLTQLELMRLGTKPKEALPRKYDVELYAALKRGTVRNILAGGNAVVWPERFRKVGYYYEIEKEMLKLKPHGKALTSTLEQMLRDDVVPPTGEKKKWEEPSAWPTCVANFEGDFMIKYYMTMFLMGSWERCGPRGRATEMSVGE